MRQTMIVVVLLLAATGSLAEDPKLSGTILGSGEIPLPGAIVQIYTANVKEGTSPYCPSCYADCGKRAVTDGEGRFEIPSLEPTLLFKVLVVADGYLPGFVERVDPATGPIEAALDPIPKERLAHEHTIRGRILGPFGLPVVGATAEPILAIQGTDPLTIANAKGEFAIRSERPNLVHSILVTARGLAPKKFLDLAPGLQVHELRLEYGATVRGRMMDGSQPVRDAVMGIITCDREISVVHSEVTIRTNEAGYFEFSSMPPNREYYVYAKRLSVVDRGASQISLVRSGNSDSTQDVGIIEVVPGHRVAGRVVMEDSSPIPPKTQLMWSRDDSWDAFFYKLESDGRFQLEHVFAGEYDVSIRVLGYRMSSKNHSLNPITGVGLVGSVTEDMDGLTILLERGDQFGRYVANASSEQWDQVELMRAERIRGVDAAAKAEK